MLDSTKEFIEKMKKANEFWEGMEIVETSKGSFKADDGTQIGFSQITWQKKTKTEDADYEVLTPKQLTDGTK